MKPDSVKKDMEALDKRLHDDFVRIDEEDAKDPSDLIMKKPEKKPSLDAVLVQETNQDGLMRGHTPY